MAGSISGRACAAAGRRVAATVDDRVGAVDVVTTRRRVGESSTSYTREVLIARAVTGQARTEVVAAADGVCEYNITVVGMFVTNGIVVVNPPSLATSAILDHPVRATTRARAVDTVTSGERVATVRRRVAVGADATSHADGRRSVSVHRVETGNTFTAIVRAAVAAGNGACAVGGLATKAADRS